MTSDPIALMTPRILIVDDERQIHASIRLRLGRDYDLVYSFDGPDALEKIKSERFDLCFADIHMPYMNGLKFVELAQQVDPALGFVVVSAFDTDVNLHRAVPLQLYEFLTKPLPERDGFEARVPGWVERTRVARRNHELALQSTTLAAERDSALLERDVEFVASESARDGLSETANLLTTVHAHIVSGLAQLSSRGKSDSSLLPIIRNLEQGKKAADAAMMAAGKFFDSAYGSRDSSPALMAQGISDAVNIAMRASHADVAQKHVDIQKMDEAVVVRGLSGIDFLRLMFPAVTAALLSAPPNSTVGIRAEHFPRLDAVSKDPRHRAYLWINRKRAPANQPGILVTIFATAPALTRSQLEDWTKGKFVPFSSVAHHGLIAGIEKCHGLLGVAIGGEPELFRILMALPT
jgi:CheY-like chemotaxis protein